MKDEITDSLVASDSIFKASPQIPTFQDQFSVSKISKNAVSYLPDMSSYLNKMDRVWTVNYIDENDLFIRLTRNSRKTEENDKQ